MIWILVAMAAGAALFAFRAKIWAAVKKLAAKAGSWLKKRIVGAPAPAPAPKPAPAPAPVPPKPAA